MAEEKYRIVVWLSHRRISLFYRQGTGELQPFPGGDWPEPLALLPGENGVVLGSEAVLARNAGNARAITDYFAELQRTPQVRVGATDIPMRQLLLLALEDRFRDVLQTVFYNNYGNLEANRAEMPLLLTLAPDIRENEKYYLRSLLAEAGYRHMETHDMDSLVATCLLPSAKPLLIADSDGQDLHLTLRPRSGACKRHTIPGAGADPRVELVADKIWEDACNQILDGDTQKKKDQEWDNVRRAAIDFLRSGENSRSGLLTVSTGESGNYYVRKPSVFATDTPQTLAISNAVENFLTENGVNDKGEAILLLWGDAAGNHYFHALLAPGFTAAHQQNRELRTRVRNYLATTHIGDQPPLPPIQTGTIIVPPVPPEDPTEPKPPTPPAPPADEWTQAEINRLRLKAVQATGSMRVGNRDKVSIRLAEMRQIAHGRPWPQDHAADIARLEEFAAHQPAVNAGAHPGASENDGTSTGRKDARPVRPKNAGKPTPPIPTPAQTPDTTTVKPPKPPKPKAKQPKPADKEWPNDELRELRQTVATAEGALRAGNKQKAAERLADIRRLRRGRPWPETKPDSDGHTWRERIQEIENQTN